jgi:alpha,alpha-trehalase
MTAAGHQRADHANAAGVIPYQAIERHGVIGDRRTAALIGADGTIDWFCLPDFDGAIVFGSLLDWSAGGHWKFGPAKIVSGEQRYFNETAVLETGWKLDEGRLSCVDAMLWPEDHRNPADQDARILVRRLQCTEGKVQCVLDLQPGYMFHRNEIKMAVEDNRVLINVGDFTLQLWSTAPVETGELKTYGRFDLTAGEEVWAVLSFGRSVQDWSVQRAEAALQNTTKYWGDWNRGLKHRGFRHVGLQRAALTIHLLTYAPSGAQVAAATTSLPEAIGGSWNADYRFSWLRDTSLACAALTWLGDWKETERYFRWLTTVPPGKSMPLQVLYGIHGETEPKQNIVKGASGYRASRPVRIGNHAYRQLQMSSFGFLADCALIYLNAGGSWNKEYGNLIRAVAEYAASHWSEADNSIWELSKREHYVSSRVMSWVVLDRAAKIMRKISDEKIPDHWDQAAAAIRREILLQGWSERLKAFRQCYGFENLDAAALLIPILDFLPPDDPRVLSTIDRVAEELSIDEFVFRFNPEETPGVQQLPLGQLEGAFLPCTFWLATAYAKTRRPGRALAILERAEKIAGSLGVFAEAVDPRTLSFAGNTPLLFSHVEYVRAVLALAECGRDRIN